MDYGFNTQKELYTRVRPALHAKVEEFKRLNYAHIREIDIWKYLGIVKWSKSNNLTLADIVSDIIHLDPKKINNYLRKIKR